MDPKQPESGNIVEETPSSANKDSHEAHANEAYLALSVSFDEDDDDSSSIEHPQIEAIEDFEALNLHPQLLEQVQGIGWTKPTPVQSLCLPLTLKGIDVAGFAQTGTGKTGVFLLTVANALLKFKEQSQKSIQPFAVILAPTRELALQIENDAEELIGPLNITTMAVFGGMDYEKQAKQLRDGCDVVVATPGRLKDFYKKKEFNFEGCKVFVCDEADRMLDMGFIEDVEFFLDRLDEGCQKLLFSATTNETVKELAFEYLERPQYISVNPETMTPENIVQKFIPCHSTEKLRVILGYFQSLSPACAIIFTNTKLVADWLHFKLVHNGIPADIITGDLPQRKRIDLIKKIKAGEIKALVATDVASRGLHISGVTHVFNFDLPDDPANYVHRVGRTARAGAEGESYTLVCDDYGHNLVGIQELLGAQYEIECQWYNPEFLKIEDKAGNPYKIRAAQAAQAQQREPASDQPQDSRRGASSRRGTSEKGRGGRGDQKRRGPGADGQGQRNQTRDGRQESNRPSGGRRHEGKQRRPKHEQGQVAAARPQHKTPALSIPVKSEKAPQGALAWVKKIWSVFSSK